MKITIREMRKTDTAQVVDYFVKGDSEFLKSMGADVKLLPKREDWIQQINITLDQPIKEKNIFYIIWQLNNQPLGHSNINNIIFGQSAKMHLHLWNKKGRKKGLGLRFLHKTIPFYFEAFQLQKLICEPYALNMAPNKVLKKIGFPFIKKYQTIPGKVCFEQPVNRYEMTKEAFEKNNFFNDPMA